MDTPHQPSTTDERPLSKITGTGPGPYHHAPVPEVQLGGVGRPWWQRVLLLVVGLALFVTALGLMKEGARSLIPALDGSIFTDNGWSALGVGWLGACLVELSAAAGTASVEASFSPGGAVPPAVVPGPRAAAVRAWAREQGVVVSDRGRIPADVVRRYEAAGEWPPSVRR
jgi:hypothetical protein